MNNKAHDNDPYLCAINHRYDSSPWAYVVMPDGQTVGERPLSNIEKAYLTNHIPTLPAIGQTGGEVRFLTADSNLSKNGAPTDAGPCAFSLNHVNSPTQTLSTIL
jgi:hypothetical protein